MKRLENAAIITIADNMTQKGEELEGILYSQYKNAYMLSSSNNYRGTSANACKNYISNVTINILQGFFNILSETEETLSGVRQCFLDYESTEDGIVDTDVLTQADGEVTDVYQADYRDLIGQVDGVLTTAAQYISLTPLSKAAVDGAYTALTGKLGDIHDDLISSDSTAKGKLDTLLTHMQALERMIDSVDQIIDAEGHIDYTMVSQLMTREDFYVEDAEALSAVMEEDPFSYYANGGSGFEQQWAAGAFQDVYMFGGLSAWTGEYSAGYHDGRWEGKAQGSFFEANAGAQFTDYLRATAGATIVHGEGEVRAGFSSDYIGVAAEGGASVLDANANVRVGTDDFNGYLDANATLFGASGYAKAEFDSPTDFCIGLGGDATLASADATLGVSFLSVSEEDSATGEETSLFNLSATPEANAGVGADFLIESQKVIDTDFVDINTAHVKLGGKLGLGLTLDITIPYPTLW